MTALVLSLILGLTSLTLAAARGDNPDLGMDVVICSGIGMTTITIGPDGQPVEKTHVCPDGASIFAAGFTLPLLTPPVTRLVGVVMPSAKTRLTTHKELAPSARGPPLTA